jgi:hypothetical protein
LKPPSRSSAPRPSVLAAHQSAGIHKKARRGRQLSAKARRRHEKGIEMAEAVIERTGQKVKRSVGHQRVIKERSKAWDKVNKDVDVDAPGADDDDEEDAKSGDDKAWETDEEMDGDADAAASKKDVSTTAAAPKTTDSDDDEIL